MGDIFGIVGTTQGPFSVEQVVAEGGFGVVYRAYHGAFRAPVALKCLKIPGEIPGDLRERFLEQFREEGEMLFRLSAAIPAVVRPLHQDVISTSSGGFIPFIALEWLDGETLDMFIARRTRQRERPLGPAEAAALLTPVARALEAAHSFPGATGPICVTHRDLKPANIFLADVHGTQVVKILDFGIARARDVASVIAGATTTGGATMAFSPRYGSPEQWAPKRFGATGPWTDVWGLALTYVEMLAGRPILEGDPMAIMGTALDERRRPTPRSEGIDVPDALELALQRALALDPRNRQKDAGAFWDEVERALGMPLSQSPIGRGTGRHPVVRVPGGGPSSLGSRAQGPRSSAGPASVVHGVPSSRAVPSPRPEPDPMELDLPLSGGDTLASGGARPPDRRGPPSPRNTQERPLPLTPQLRKPIGAMPDRPPPSTGLGVPMSLDLSGDASRPRARPHLGTTTLAPLERPSTSADLKALFSLPLRIAGAGVGLGVIDIAISALFLSGEHLGLGPIKLLWVAALLILVAIGVAGYRLMSSSR
ncbi:serine/threonine protein kinase [Chondromyces apiculatus]|uniref:Serine/threonine protein kinase n=1 Tax=Chondromyces apiculatus DSM 436 TaxID=1192034 RepID=A0A017TED1_9BACT|nr:serine/threonine-protein kinase [Chondromyces apiculatus]EYF07643.1 Serine/threonine protein kinase [Chondromyces apiculatus DSM 436]